MYNSWKLWINVFMTSVPVVNLIKHFTIIIYDSRKLPILWLYSHNLRCKMFIRLATGLATLSRWCKSCCRIWTGQTASSGLIAGKSSGSLSTPLCSRSGRSSVLAGTNIIKLFCSDVRATSRFIMDWRFKNLRFLIGTGAKSFNFL